MVFYAANLHFGNDDIARRRHYRDASSMNLRIIENWNSIITQEDSVYILGGVGEFEFLTSLNGDISIFFTESERRVYDKYISSVTSDLNDPYNQEMFDVYVKNMFYINKVLYQSSVIRRDYSGSLVRMSVSVSKIKNSDYYVIAGGIGSNQRMFRNGINSDIYVNGMFPLSEVDVQESRNRENKVLI